MQTEGDNPTGAAPEGAATPSATPGQDPTTDPAPSPAPVNEGSTPVDNGNPTEGAGSQTTPDGGQGGATSDPAPAPEPSDLPEELFFNGHPVQVEVPEELAGQLSEAGVDANKVISELYGKDSDFTLSDETRAPLDEKFGKPLVDTFLQALKAQNEHALHLTESQKAEAEKVQQQAVEWSNELVGGEENWDAMSSWAEKNLEDSQIDGFNKAMESGDKYIQELAIKDLQSKMQGQEGDSDYSLVSGEAATETGGGALSANEYLAEMTSPEFTKLKGHDRIKAQQALDARRRLGLKRGI